MIDIQHDCLICSFNANIRFCERRIDEDVKWDGTETEHSNPSMQYSQRYRQVVFRTHYLSTYQPILNICYHFCVAWWYLLNDTPWIWTKPFRGAIRRCWIQMDFWSVRMGWLSIHRALYCWRTSDNSWPAFLHPNGYSGTSHNHWRKPLNVENDCWP